MVPKFQVEVPVRQESERVWLVRASGGQYVRHFKHAGIVAIGHFDALEFAPESGSGLTEVTLSTRHLRDTFETKLHVAKATVTSHISQAQQFCSEAKVGDLVVTVDSGFVAVGRVAGYAFFDRTPVDLSTDIYKDVPMVYQLRRPVVWGPSFGRRELPLPMERVFRSHRTVFEITKFWDYIYHLLYPAFVYKDELHITLRVRQDESIRNRDVLSLLSILQEFEKYAAELAGDYDFDTLTVRAGFFSKGDIWPRLTAKEKKRAFYLLLATLLLGGGQIGPFKLNGVGELTKEIIEAAEKIITRHEGADALRNMKIQTPRMDTGPIEQVPVQPVNRETILIARQ